MYPTKTIVIISIRSVTCDLVAYSCYIPAAFQLAYSGQRGIPRRKPEFRTFPARTSFDGGTETYKRIDVCRIRRRFSTVC